MSLLPTTSTNTIHDLGEEAAREKLRDVEVATGSVVEKDGASPDPETLSTNVADALDASIAAARAKVKIDGETS